MSRRVIYYSDELNDDFAGTDINTRSIDDSYNYVPSSPLWKSAAFVVYRIIATPLVWLLCKLVCGLKIKNRAALKKLRGKGFFMYGNHTHGMADAFTPTLAAFPHRAHIIVNPDAVSIKGLGQIVAMLGALPIPATLKGMKAFRMAIEERYSQNRVIAVYPEAHIWPYYTGVRPFPNTSFIYPVKLDAPCVAYAATYRQRRIFKKLPPLMTITLSDPIYPDTTLSEHAAKQKLRDEVHDFLVKTVCTPDNYEHIKYVYKPKSEMKTESAATAAVGLNKVSK